MRGHNMIREEMDRRLHALESELKSAQDRGAISRNVVFREYANGRVLLREDWAESAIEHYSARGNLAEALRGVANELSSFSWYRELRVAIACGIEKHQYVFVLIYPQA